MSGWRQWVVEQVNFVTYKDNSLWFGYEFYYFLV